MKKKIDNVGRIVIPIQIRKDLNLKNFLYLVVFGALPLSLTSKTFYVYDRDYESFYSLCNLRKEAGGTPIMLLNTCEKYFTSR